MRAWIVAIVMVVACSKAAKTTPERPAPRVAADYTLDGTKLGMSYAKQVMARDPYQEPCDNDPIGDKSRRAMVYGGEPCRDHAFPDHTTVVFEIDMKGGDDYDAPIRAMAWLGGSYFDSRSDFPLHVGEKADRASVLGTARGDLTLEDHDVTLIVRRFDGDVAAILDGDVIVGYVLGPMPASADDEQWSVISQMYRRYTRRPDRPLEVGDPSAVGAHGVTRGQCAKAIEHVKAIFDGDPHVKNSDKQELRDPHAIDKCLDELDRAKLDCIMKAQDTSALDACG